VLHERHEWRGEPDLLLSFKCRKGKANLEEGAEPEKVHLFVLDDFHRCLFPLFMLILGN